MDKYKDINLEPFGHGVIVVPIEVKQSLITPGGLSTTNKFEKEEFVWKGECEVVKVGPSVEDLKPGDKVFMNLGTTHKLPFEHKGKKMIWTLAQALFAKII